MLPPSMLCNDADKPNRNLLKLETTSSPLGSVMSIAYLSLDNQSIKGNGNGDGDGDGDTPHLMCFEDVEFCFTEESVVRSWDAKEPSGSISLEHGHNALRISSFYTAYASHTFR